MDALTFYCILQIICLERIWGIITLTTFFSPIMKTSSSDCRKTQNQKIVTNSRKNERCSQDRYKLPGQILISGNAFLFFYFAPHSLGKCDRTIKCINHFAHERTCISLSVRRNDRYAICMQIIALAIIHKPAVDSYLNVTRCGTVQIINKTLFTTNT